MEDDLTPSSLLLKQHPENLLYDLDQINMILCELDPTSAPFRYTKILTYDSELPPSGNQLVLIYWMMKILQCFMLLIQYQIYQPVINFQHRLRKMCG